MDQPANAVFEEMTSIFGGELSKFVDGKSYEFHFANIKEGYYEVEASAIDGKLANVRLKWNGDGLYAALDAAYGAKARVVCWNNMGGKPCMPGESGAKLVELQSGCVKYFSQSSKFRVINKDICLSEVAGNGTCATSCRDNGECLETPQGCQATSDWLCKQSGACYKQGRCVASGGSCVRADSGPTPEEKERIQAATRPSIPRDAKMAQSIVRNANPPWGDNFVALWQKVGPGELMTQDEASRYCESLMVEGIDGWYLPALGQMGSVLSIWNEKPTASGGSDCGWTIEGNAPCGEYWTGNFGETCKDRACWPDKSTGTVLDTHKGTQANRAKNYKAMVRCSHKDMPELF